MLLLSSPAQGKPPLTPAKVEEYQYPKPVSLVLVEELSKGSKGLVDCVPVDDGLVVDVDQLLKLGAGAQVGQVLVAAHLGVVLKATVHGHVKGLEALIQLGGGVRAGAGGRLNDIQGVMVMGLGKFSAR